MGELGAAKTMPKLFVGQRLGHRLSSGSIRVRHLIATSWWWLALATTNWWPTKPAGCRGLRLRTTAQLLHLPLPL